MKLHRYGRRGRGFESRLSHHFHTNLTKDSVAQKVEREKRFISPCRQFIFSQYHEAKNNISRSRILKQKSTSFLRTKTQ